MVPLHQRAGHGSPSSRGRPSQERRTPGAARAAIVPRPAIGRSGACGMHAVAVQPRVDADRLRPRRDPDQDAIVAGTTDAAARDIARRRRRSRSHAALMAETWQGFAPFSRDREPSLSLHPRRRPLLRWRTVPAARRCLRRRRWWPPPLVARPRAGRSGRRIALAGPGEGPGLRGARRIGRGTARGAGHAAGAPCPRGSAPITPHDHTPHSAENHRSAD